MSQRNGSCHNGTTAEVPPIAPLPNNGRDKEGRFTQGNAHGHRFAKGNRGGPGNPVARRAAELKQSFLKAVTPEKMQQLAAKLFEQAVTGDTTAATLFLNYTLGRPRSEVDADTLDLQEWQILSASPTLHRLMACLLDAIPPERALEDLKHILGLRATQLAKELGNIHPDLLTAERQAQVGK